MKRAACAVVAVAVTLLAARAAAEPPPPTRITVPAVCRDGADPPHELSVAPGSVLLTEEAWDHLDIETKVLQDDRTRLKAENESLRKSASSGPGWLWVVSGIATAAAAGYAAGRIF